MRYYYRVADGQAMDLYEVDGEIEGLYHPDVKFVEVTGLDPMPQFGWLYDPDTNTLSPPPPPYVDPRPPILAELAEVEQESVRLIRQLILANPGFGEGSQERDDLAAKELRFVQLRSDLEELDNPSGN